MSEILKGSVADIRMQKDNGWAIASVLAGGKHYNVVGVMPRNLKLDDVVECVGTFKDHPVYGAQFQVASVVSHMGSDPAAIEAWLILRLPNIGPARAKALVDRFGSGLWAIIERTPKLLSTVNGITEQRADEIVAAYSQVSAERVDMIYLIDLGLKAAQAAAVLKSFGGPDLKQNLQNNPYMLSTVRGISFKEADVIGVTKLKYPKTGKYRAQSFLRNVLTDGLMSGDCYQVRHSAMQAVAEGMDVSISVVDAALADGCPGVIARGKRFLLEDIDADEASVALSVKELLAQAVPLDAIQ